MGLDQFLKTFHHHRGECDWTVVVMTGWFGLLGYEDDGGPIQTWG